ncbi:MAG: hypothetical protein OK441_00420 [Thaumarchaeota archaeon]|nr:hypothetical protein [Nitrososphaerota archaeon]
MPRRSAIGRAVVVIVIIAVLLVALGANFLFFASSPGASTSITTSSGVTFPSTSSFTSSTTQVTSSPNPVTVDPSILGYCPSFSSNSSGFMGAAVGGSAPSVICLKFFYFNAFKGYNASSPLVLNITGALSIAGVESVYSEGLAYPEVFDGSQNFTLTVSQAQLAIGGPTNENEGAVVAFSLTANAGTSGSYELGLFPSTSFGLWLLNPQEPEQCGYYGELVAGNGFPDYAQSTGGCLTYPPSGLPSSHTVGGVPYELMIGDLYFSVTGVTNSTGY